MYQCYQVRVQYIDESYRNNSFVDEYRDREWKNLSRFDTLEVEVSLNQECNQRGHKYQGGQIFKHLEIKNCLDQIRYSTISQ